MPGKSGVISGMRSSCEIVIEVNLWKAVLGSNLPFYISENKVILSPGTKEGGYVPPENFRSVLDIKKHEYIYMAPFDYLVVYDFECQCEEDRGATLKFNVWSF